MARPDDQKCAKAACFERQQATASHAEAGRWVSSHAAERALARSSAHADEEAFAQRWDSTNQGLVASLPGSEIECVYRLGAGGCRLYGVRVRESALSVGKVGDDREVVRWPQAVYWCIAA
jgi:hypothetical protein